MWVLILNFILKVASGLAWKQTYVSPALKFAGRRRAKYRSDENVVKTLYRPLCILQ
jgi:putative NADH-flavin reductase